MRGKRRLPIRSGFLNSILGAAGREEREENCVRERIRSAQFVFMKQRKQEREIKERDPNESEQYQKESHLERVHALPVLVQVIHEIHIIFSFV